MSERNWCWPLLHDWGKWGPYMTNVQGYGMQWRRCKRCGKEHVRWL